MNFFRRLSPKTLGIGAAVITIVIWTTFIVIGRYMALQTLRPMDIVFCRIIGAAMILLPWGYVLRHRWLKSPVPERSGLSGPSFWLSPLPAGQTMLLGLVGGVLYPVLAYSAFTHAPAAHGAVLMPGLLPLTTALMSVLLLGAVLNLRQRWGLAMILGGGLMVGGYSVWLSYTQASEGATVWFGDLLFVSASSSWAFYTVQCRKHQLQAVPATIALIVFSAWTALPLYLLAVWSGLLVSHLSVAPWSEILFQTFWQGVGSVVISGITFTQMIRYFGPVRSTMLTAIVPGLSALGAVLFLGEPLGIALLLGLVLVTMGIVVGVRAGATAPQQPSPEKSA